MYCSSCGAALERGLKYCNRCGVRLGQRVVGISTSEKELSPDSLVWAIVSVFIFGLGVIIGLMAVMKEVVGFNTDVITGVSLLCLLMLFSVEGIFVRLLFGRRRLPAEGDPASATEHATNELEEQKPRALPEPVASVTEHTTRTFEPTYMERESE